MEDAEAILGRIYGSLDSDEALNNLPYAIAEYVGSRSCTFVLFDPNHHLEFMKNSYFSNEMNSFYKDNGLYLLDDWADTIISGKVGLTSRYTDNADIGKFLKSFLYNEFIRKFGDDSTHCMAFGNECPDGGMAMVGLHKSITQPDFTPAQVARLDGLKSHVSRMAHIRRKLQAKGMRGAAALESVNALSDCVLILRLQGKPIFANVAAENLLKSSRRIKLRKGRILFVDPATQDAFTKALHSIRLGQGVSFCAAWDDRPPWRIHFVPRAIQGRTHALMWIEAETPATTALERMKYLYHLTDSETAVASLIGEGLSAKQISERLHASVPTVRTHLSHIFDKTETNKASQIARLINSIPRFR